MNRQRKLFKIICGLILVIFLCHCSSHNAAPIESSNRYAGNFAANVLPVLVGDCGPHGYENEPCTRVKICAPGTSECQVIENILLDTGSYGLRIFSSQIKVKLKQSSDKAGNAIGECAQFGTSNTWGPVQIADVILSGEPAVSIPIQVIDVSFKNPPTACSSPDTSAEEAGYNGILGVGLLAHDCGSDCVESSAPGVYFSCGEQGCKGTPLGLDQQVVNPVAVLPVDNNGVILELPSVGASGVAKLTGTLTLGIGTANNNTPDASGLKLFAADSSGDFKTQFQNHTYQSSFIDSGSNGLFFPENPELPLCNSLQTKAGFYCPSNTQNFLAYQIGADGKTKVEVSFSIANANVLVNSFGANSGAFVNLGGTQTAAFDWGLPFFFGRKVYVGFEGAESKLSKGPYWAW